MFPDRQILTDLVELKTIARAPYSARMFDMRADQEESRLLISWLVYGVVFPTGLEVVSLDEYCRSETGKLFIAGVEKSILDQRQTWQISSNAETSSDFTHYLNLYLARDFLDLMNSVSFRVLADNFIDFKNLTLARMRTTKDSLFFVMEQGHFTRRTQIQPITSAIFRSQINLNQLEQEVM